MARALRMRRAARGSRTAGKVFVLGLVYLFILAPMLSVVLAASNDSPTFPSEFAGLTGRWFVEVFQSPGFVDALLVSTRVAAGAALGAAVCGLPLALVLNRVEFKGRAAMEAFFMSPLVVPQVVLSLAILQIFVVMSVRLSIWALLAAHIVLVLPFVLRATLASLTVMGTAVEEAAATLGANPWRTFLHVTAPMIRPGVTAGLVLAFIISFVNVPLSLFLVPSDGSTLPIEVLSVMETRLSPLIAAVGTLTLGLAIAASLVVEKVFKVRLFL